MKEATGELNMTVITVVAIAAVGALFTIFVWPNIQGNLMLSTACSQVSANGNYEKHEDGGTENIQCKNFTCTATYNGHTYSKNCNEDGDNNNANNNANATT